MAMFRPLLLLMVLALVFSIGGSAKAGCSAASFKLRREAMLRRTLKEGATFEAVAMLYGYTQEEVSDWAPANEPRVDLYYDESREPSPDVLEAEQALAELRVTLGLTP
jgi:hypothetical protein